MQRYIALHKVIEVGSFTKAAELLGYTQPALSQMIASLEKELAMKKSLLLQDLAEEPFLLLEEGAYSEPLEALRTAGITPKVKLRVHDDYSILSMVEQGLGVSVLAELVLHKTSYDVVTLPIEPPIIRTLGIVTKDRRKLPLASKEFIRCILEHKENLL